MMKDEDSRATVVIPTYRREHVLIDTLHHLLPLRPAPASILVIDQTEFHTPDVHAELTRLAKTGAIRWIRLSHPSIPHAMNLGLLEADTEIVIFLDDDILPDRNLLEGHVTAHRDGSVKLVAGRVIQPWDEPESPSSGGFRFCDNRRQWIDDFIGCNFSVKRSTAIGIGGFDENFVRAAYRFEKDFAERLRAAGHRALFEPMTSLKHLHEECGGTRSYGNHLKTASPSHAVGDYYYLLRSRCQRFKLARLLLHPLRAISTRHHLRNPWWIPISLFAEISALALAVRLAARGPRYLDRMVAS